MRLFDSKELTKDKIKSYNFYFIIYKIKNHILTITLNRTDKKNALHPQMINEIALIMEYAKISKYIRVVVIQANGDVFCSGLDLNAIKGKIDIHNSTVPKPKEKVLIGEIFSKCYKPIISKITGDVYAGGHLIVANSTYAVALENINFVLPEVKRGLFPMQVMASLLRVMTPRNVIDWCIRGFNITSKKAKKWGLISVIANTNNIDDIIDKWIQEVVSNSPKAINLGMEAFDSITNKSNDHEFLYEMLQKTIKSKDAEEGLRAFREKRKPKWLND